jgi:large subunit ribosomal protein L23
MSNNILKRPVVSEKSSKQIEGKKFTFVVDKNATKIDIKNHIKATFDVDVEKVNILNVKPKKRRRGKVQGESKPKRKAIITILEEKNLDKIKQFF